MFNHKRIHTHKHSKSIQISVTSYGDAFSQSSVIQNQGCKIDQYVRSGCGFALFDC